ncbi:hypothetical protein Csa_009376 [Cucumis sativus]|nr:hypothetical protein Csa_009376 [Cucumis sativus]
MKFSVRMDILHALPAATNLRMNVQPARGLLAIIVVEQLRRFLNPLNFPANNQSLDGNGSDHKKTCLYAPCLCPYFDCKFMASSKQLSLHFSNKHTDSATNFHFRSSFTICLKTDDTYHVLQEQDGPSLVLQSSMKNIQSSSDYCHSTRVLMIPRDLFSSSGMIKLNICIWQNGSSPVHHR